MKNKIKDETTNTGNNLKQKIDMMVRNQKEK